MATSSRWTNIRVDRELHERMAEAARRDHRSITSWLAVTLERVLAEADAGARYSRLDAVLRPPGLDPEVLRARSAAIAEATAAATRPLDMALKSAERAQSDQHKRLKKQAKALRKILKAKEAERRAAGQPETMDDPVRGIRYTRAADDDRTKSAAPDPEQAIRN